MASYNLFYRDPIGNLIATIPVTSTMRMEYIRSENDYGSLYIDLPPTWPIDFFKIDGRLEIWRKIYDWQPAYLETETVWLIRLVRKKIDERGSSRLHLLAYDLNHLLERRIIAYASESTYAKKTTYADDMLKSIVKENLGALATDTARSIATYLSVQANLSAAPSIEKAFAWQKLLPQLQECADASLQAGTYLAFDTVYTAPNAFEFRTYTGQRGIDRGTTSANPFVLTVDDMRLSYASLTFDHTKEITYVYAGGQGQESDRRIAEATDAVRVNLSPFNRVEDFYDARNISDDDEALPAEARARLKEGMPKIAVSGHVSQTPSSVYGLHYGWGDIVTIQHEDYTLDVHLDKVHVTVQDGNEDIEIMARNLENSYY